jgi:hypothetical protein
MITTELSPKQPEIGQTTQQSKATLTAGEAGEVPVSEIRNVGVSNVAASFREYLI